MKKLLGAVRYGLLLGLLALGILLMLARRKLTGRAG